MIKKIKGFTLIELLIVIAILSILTALSIPHLLAAIQKGKQKGTIGYIHILATHLTDYLVDNLNFGNEARSFSEISQGDLDFLVPFYCLAYPTKDRWGNNLRVALGNNGGRGYNPRRGSEYIIDSRAKDGEEDGWSYDNNITYGDGAKFDFYEINSINDFDNDIVMISGDFVHAPASAVGSQN
jgi:prepilin-type N-terminal cleavage/methylation domain-containing protein